jgi:hypothetical protein
MCPGVAAVVGHLRAQLCLAGQRRHLICSPCAVPASTDETDAQQIVCGTGAYVCPGVAAVVEHLWAQLWFEAVQRQPMCYHATV